MLIFDVAINLTNDGVYPMQSLKISCEDYNELIDKLRSSLLLFDGQLDSISISQFQKKERFEKKDLKKE